MAPEIYVHLMRWKAATTIEPSPMTCGPFRCTQEHGRYECDWKLGMGSRWRKMVCRGGGPPRQTHHHTAQSDGFDLVSPVYGSEPAAANLDPHAARTLLAVTRQLFPHERIEMRHYAAAVDTLRKKSHACTAINDLLLDVVAHVDAAHGLPWVDLSADARRAVLVSLERTAFFPVLRTMIIASLYGNPEVQKMFGYGGSSVEFGGYIGRGFDDIDWLSDN